MSSWSPRETVTEKQNANAQVKEEWRTVTRKRNPGKTEKDKKEEKNKAPAPSANNGTARRRKPPRTAAISIKVRDESTTYAEILKKARGEITLSEFKIENQRIRKGINGSIIIEIAGQDSQDKANSGSETIYCS